MEKSFIPFVQAIVILNTFILSSSITISNFTTDHEALLAFKNAITSDPSGILVKNWSINTSICNWIGVYCSTESHRIITLNVSNFELKGTLPPHLGNLTFLQSLDISFNNFTGEIPSWFGALYNLQHIYLNNNAFFGKIPLLLFNISKLRTLDIEYNFLDGNVPKEIGNLSSMEILNFRDNQFTGYIPSGIFRMSSLIGINMRGNRLSGKLPSDMCSNTNPKLKRINLSSNKLSGEIPANIYRCGGLEELRLSSNQFNGSIPGEIGSLSELRIFNLATNHFQGRIPKQIGNLTSLRRLDLAYNMLGGELPEELGNLAYLEIFAVPFNNFLSGPIPSSIFNVSALKALAFQQNNFSGNLPSSIGLSLFNLEYLFLYSNQLSGEIPSSITNASKLMCLELSINSFSGSIPDLGSLTLLKVLRLWDNRLTGSQFQAQELRFLSSLTSCRKLEVLEISGNPFNGLLPTSIGNLSTSLVKFFAMSCNIRGSIPSEIGNLSSLQALSLSQNQLTGFIPRTIGKLNQIVEISLGDNLLEGHVPDGLCQMTNLALLDLSYNMLTGSIPECLGEVKSLRRVYFSSNKLNSTIPLKFWDLVHLVDLDLGFNYLTGQLSSRIGSWKISLLNLSSNQFTGDIPSSIGGCQSLEFLSLANNKFGGSIPLTLTKLRCLRMLNLSYNDLTGVIPINLQDLRFLEHFDVSYNKLGGEIPNGIANSTAQSFAHNSALCGATKFHVSPCVNDHGRSKSKNTSLIVASVTLVAILVVVVVLMHTKRRKQITIPPAADISLGDFVRRRISYIELVQGTSSFNETNLLGRGSFGSVYKATLSDGLNIAVKVFNLQLQGATKSFVTETEILRSIRHRNLVRVVGCCTNQEFKALILEYMSNGSLEKWLHSGRYDLDLVQRLNIAIDVAFALEYLHHGHTFPVVHCDIKPDNVLLDEEMKARVGDFGISKLFDEGEAMTLTTTLATIGYVSPEYGMEGKVSTNSDVYSYGILLLEMFTSKKPTNDMFNQEMSLKDWVNEALQKNAAREIVAPGLLSSEDQHLSAKEQCVLSVFDVAMKCLAFFPGERINMIQVVAILNKIKANVMELNNRHGRLQKNRPY